MRAGTLRPTCAAVLIWRKKVFNFLFGDIVEILADTIENADFLSCDAEYIREHPTMKYLVYETSVSNFTVGLVSEDGYRLPGIKYGYLRVLASGNIDKYEASRMAVEGFAVDSEKKLNLFAQAREQQASFYADKGMERLTEQYLHDSFLYRLLAERIVCWAKEGFDGHNETGKG